MVRFELTRPKTTAEARELLAGKSKSVFKAGGIDLLDHLKEHLVEPSRLVDLRAVAGLAELAVEPGGGVRIGAAVTLAQVAAHEAIRTSYPALAEACGSAASPQIRNVATIGGNVLQRPRCWYYRLESYKCLKKGGDVCFAMAGENRYHSIFGGGPVYAPHPSSAAVALVAHRAAFVLEGPKGTRAVPAEEFFVLPDKDPTRENVLSPDEILVAIQLPPAGGWKSAYAEIKERAGFDWPLVSAAVALEIDGGAVREARVVLGQVAPIPWRSAPAEKALIGNQLGETTAAAASLAAVKGAEPMSDNGYKVALTAALVRRVVASFA